MFVQRTISIVLALVIVVISVGIPLPGAIPLKSDEDFPCRYHACGCLNAEMCRTHCCCHTSKPDRQKRDIVAKSCCQKKEKKALSCCSTKSKSCEPADNAHKNRSKINEIVINALQCQGISLGLAAIAPVILRCDELIIPTPASVGETIEPCNDAMFALADIQPVTPPPRPA